MVGDGTLGEGLLYEAMNLAAVWSVPVLFVVECNGIAQTTYTASTVAGDVVGRGHAFGLDCWRVGDDEARLWQVAETAVASVRERRRPGFLVIDTGRLGPHSKGDDMRPEAEMAALRARDPGGASGRRPGSARRAAIEAAADAYFSDLVEAALASPEARFAAVPQSLFDGAVLPNDPAGHTSAPGATVRAALNAVLERLLAEDERTILLGEDLHDPYGGAFKVTAGLSTRYPDRVISMPISEAVLTGSAIGLALAGRRPIAEVMFADFLTLCADQLADNHAVKFPGVFPDAFGAADASDVPPGGAARLRSDAQPEPGKPDRRDPRPDGGVWQSPPRFRPPAVECRAALAVSDRVPGAQAAVWHGAGSGRLFRIGGACWRYPGETCSRRWPGRARRPTP